MKIIDCQCENVVQNKKKKTNNNHLTHTPRFGCTFLTPIVDFGGSTGTLEFKKSTLGAPVEVSSDFNLISSFFGAICKPNLIGKMLKRNSNFMCFHIQLITLLVKVIKRKKKKSKRQTQTGTRTNLGLSCITGTNKIIIL